MGGNKNKNFILLNPPETHKKTNENV